MGANRLQSCHWKDVLTPSIQCRHSSELLNPIQAASRSFHRRLEDAAACLGDLRANTVTGDAYNSVSHEGLQEHRGSEEDLRIQAHHPA